LPAKATQIDCICPSTQRKPLEFTQKQLKIDCILFHEAQIFAILAKASQINCMLVRHAAINFQLANESNSNEEDFVLPRRENFCNLPTKAPQIGCILLLREKTLEFANKSNSI
jgi:hypothetical protein